MAQLITRNEKQSTASVDVFKKPNQTAEKYTASNFKTPVSFEPNKGQTDSKVKFLGRGLGYNLFLTPNEAVMMFSKFKAPQDKKDFILSKDRISEKPQTSVLRMQFIGANAEPDITPSETLPGKRNYLSDKEQITDVPSYGKVVYDNLYNGIGVTFYSNEQSLEYDFNVAPNIDVSTIRIKFEGAENINIASNGDLVLRFGDEEVRHLKPQIYQDVNGIRKEVKGEYGLNKNGEVSFKVNQYDKSKPLIIDPIISYSTYIGGSADDHPHSITVDNAGNSYITGYTRSSNFPPNTGAPPADIFKQVFVAKFDADGQLLFSTVWGGSGEAEGTDIEVDSAGNIYVTGDTTSSNYPTTIGAFQTVLNQGQGYGSDAFATKLNSTGNAFIYSTFLGGSYTDNSFSSAIDNTGNLYLCGSTYSRTNFPTTPGVFQTTASPNAFPAFITKLTSVWDRR